MNEGGLLSLRERHSLRPENGIELPQQGQSRYGLCRITNDYRMQSWGRSRLGTLTNLDRARKGCAYVKVGIIVAVTEGMSVSNRQVE